MKVGPVLFCLAFTALPLALPAQRQASLGAGVGVVRYAGGSSFSAFTLSPALQSLNPDSYFAVSGSASLLDSAVWAGQARADLWTMLSPPARARFGCAREHGVHCSRARSSRSPLKPRDSSAPGTRTSSAA